MGLVLNTLAILFAGQLGVADICSRYHSQLQLAAKYSRNINPSCDTRTVAFASVSLSYLLYARVDFEFMMSVCVALEV